VLSGRLTRRKLGDVVGNPDQHPRALQMIAAPDVQSYQYVTVQQHQVRLHLAGDFDAVLFEILVHGEKHVVRVPVIPVDLFFVGYDQSGFGRFSVLFPGHVQAEQVLGVLRQSVRFAQEKLDQLGRKRLVFGRRHHVYGGGDRFVFFRIRLGRLQEMFHRFRVLFGVEPVDPGQETVAFVLEMHGHAVEVLGTQLVCRQGVQQDLPVELHFAVFPRQIESLVVAFRQHEELYGGGVVVQFLEKFGDELGTFGALGLLDQFHSDFRIVQVLQLETNHRVEVFSGVVSSDRFFVFAFVLFGDGVLKVDLVGRYLRQKLADLVPVSQLDVSHGGAVVVLTLLEQTRRLRQLFVLLEDLRALFDQLLVVQLERYADAVTVIVAVQSRPRYSGLADEGVFATQIFLQAFLVVDVSLGVVPSTSEPRQLKAQH
jgi:hypothetical protein